MNAENLIFKWYFFFKVLVFGSTSYLHIKEHVVKGKKLEISEFA